MDAKIININPEILGGTPVFSGTRVPIKNLFDYLETGDTIEELITFLPILKNQIYSFEKHKAYLIEK